MARWYPMTTNVKSVQVAARFVLRILILVSFAACRLIEIHYRDGDLGPAKQPARRKPPLTGDQLAFHRNDDRVQQAHFFNALG